MSTSVSANATPTLAQLARARHATRAQFAALGVLSGAWGVHVPSVKAQYGLNEGTLSIVLLAGGLGAVLSLFGAGRLVARVGVRATILLAGLVITSALALVLQWPGMVPLLMGMVAFGAAMSVFDVAINAEGSMLEVLSGRTIMSHLHGMFSVGAMGGAAMAAGLLRAGVSPPVQLAAMAALIALTVAVAARHNLDTHPPSGEPGEAQAHFAWPHGLLLVLGLLIFAGMTAEGVMYDWCVLYLKQEVGMTQDRAGLGYAAFAGAMAAARFGGDALRNRYPEHVLLAGGAGLSAVSMALVLLSGNPWVSLAGCALVGAGLAPVVPILYNAATRVPGTSRAAAIASISSIGYSGFLIGPPTIGIIAQAASLTAAMSVVVLASGVLALQAYRVKPPQTASN